MCLKKVMHKRSHDNSWEEPPKKRLSPSGNVLPIKLLPGEIFTDITGKRWKIGKTIGCGGFGEIYLASDNLIGNVQNDAKYIAKVESHSNGPLFVEINCFLRIARKKMIDQWKLNGMKQLGIPHYVASGSFIKDHEKLRFLIMPRYEDDLEKIFLSKQNRFNLKTVIVICMQIIDALEYIHSKGYVHCDIKASNILGSSETAPTLARKLRKKKRVNYKDNTRYFQTNHNIHLRPKHHVIYDKFSDEEKNDVEYAATDQVYLIDYGLASKYRLSNGEHKPYCQDARRAHAGTTLFCSLDSHLGVQSRRSDLEMLGYNIIYWLTSSLPWVNDIGHPESVQQQKQNSLKNLAKFLRLCFGEYPQFLLDYFQYVNKLMYDSKPDYKYCKNLFQKALRDYGYKNDSRLDFENIEDWGRKLQQLKTKFKKIDRQPLTSNLLMEKLPVCKKKITRKEKLNWSKILYDPEVILRQSNKEMCNQERKISESSDNGNVLNMKIANLNPTYAMLHIYNKCRDRNGNYNSVPKNGKSDSLTNKTQAGYTPAMCMVLAKMQRNHLENHKTSSLRKHRSTKNQKKTLESKNPNNQDASPKQQIIRKTRQIGGYNLRN